MGRHCYFSDGEEYKFRFGSQPSSDIMKFGGHEYRPDYSINWEWEREKDLPLVKRRITIARKKFKKEFGETKEAFDKRMGCKFSDNERDEKAMQLSAFIDLGEIIKKGLEEEEYFSVEAEL